MNETTNPFEMVVSRIDAVCDQLDVKEAYRLRLENCERELIVHFPVKMDDGQVKVFTGYRVHHNDTRGPAKGGAPLPPRCYLR